MKPSTAGIFHGWDFTRYAFFVSIINSKWTAKVTLLPSLVSISPIRKRLKYEKVTDTDNRGKVIAIACVDLWSRCAYEICVIVLECSKIWILCIPLEIG
jgi:hypothetical protein